MFSLVFQSKLSTGCSDNMNTVNTFKLKSTWLSTQVDKLINTFMKAKKTLKTHKQPVIHIHHAEEVSRKLHAVRAIFC